MLAYAEYFSWLRIIACLSRNYDGPSFSHCYAVDPVRGEDLELDVVLPIEPNEISEIYDYKKMNYNEIKRALDVVVETWSQMDMERAGHMLSRRRWSSHVGNAGSMRVTCSLTNKSRDSYGLL